MAVCKDLPAKEGTIALLTEYMERGSLYYILHDLSDSARMYRPKTVTQRLRLCVDIANVSSLFQNMHESTSYRHYYDSLLGNEVSTSFECYSQGSEEREYLA
jgi:hypothetical protein